ncbi:MAG: single-stranded DNA-binding protein [Planctomycetes bacterium]|nr:single-stranded DNA-binding protein [Planctomycetota bacterium]
MPNLNRVMLMGNLTRDPEMRYLPTNNTAVVGFGLAINRRWRNAAGEQQEEVTFIDCEAFAKTAEVINQYMRKGRPLYVEGHLKLDQWQDKEGNKRSKLKVVVETFQFIDSRPGGEGGGGDEGGGPPRQSQAPRGNAPRSAPAPRGNAPAPGNDMDPHQPVGEDDIPF